MAPTDISISAEVDKISDGYPATDLIKVLLKYIAIDASKYVRDVQLSGQVFQRSRLIYDEIQGLMTKVQTTAAADWDSFDKYTVAIPPLERILLNVYSNNSEDKTRPHLPPSSGVDTALLFIQRWQEDREMLAQALDQLSGNTFLGLSAELKIRLGVSRQVARVADDQTTLAALYSYYTATNKLSDRDVVQPTGGRIVTDVRGAIRQINARVMQNPQTEETSTMAIRTFMIVYIPFALLVEPSTPRKSRDHLRSSEVWLAMKSLLQKVQTHIETRTPTISELGDEWRKLAELLLKLSDVSTVEDMLKLIQLAAKIRRPFHGRSVELIKILHRLDMHSSDPANSKANSNRQTLKDVMQLSVTSLEAAEKLVKDVKTISVTSPEYEQQDTNMKQVLSKIGECFTTFDITREWQAQEQSYNTAVETDETHLSLMRTRLGL